MIGQHPNESPWYMNQGALQVSKAFMFETRGYDQQYLRPYQTNYNYDVRAHLAESTNYGQNISQNTLSQVAGEFLQPKSYIDQNSFAFIDHGFQESRFSFFIELTFPEPGADAQKRFVLTGYTDRFDPSYSGLIDPTLKFYFNNLITVRDVRFNTPYGVETKSTVLESSHVLNTIDPDALYSAQIPERRTLDPHSIMREIYFQTQSFTHDVTSQITDQNVTITTPQGTIGTPRIIPRRHESRPSYLSDTVSQYRSALTQAMTDSSTFSPSMQTHQDEASWDAESIAFEEASNILRGPSVSRHPLFQGLAQNTHRFLKTGFITYDELCNTFPGLDQVMHITYLDQVSQQSAYRPGMGEHWHGSDYETLAANVISQGLPPILSDCLTRKISFMATNEGPGGHDNITYNAPPEGFVQGLDFRNFVEYFETRLRSEILSDISKQGNLIYHVNVEINMSLEVRIWISIDHQEPVLFVAPMFCDSVFTPIVTADTQDVQKVGGDIQNMLGDISGDYINTPATGILTQPNQQPAGRDQNPAMPTDFAQGGVNQPKMI